MPDNQTHFTVGAGVGILNYLLCKKARNEMASFGEIFTIGLFGGAIATLPDVVDPPNSPDHRSIGHSMVLSGLSILALIKNIEENHQMDINQKDFAKSLVWSYASHLLLDVGTPAGLPL